MVRGTVLVLIAAGLVQGCTAAPSSDVVTGSASAPRASASAITSVPPPTSLSPAATAVAVGALDQNKLAAAILGTLRTRLGDEVTVAATCPADVALEKGATSRCGATIEGQLLVYTVTQTDGEGGVDFAPASAVIDIRALEGRAAQQYAGQLGGSWTADCDTGAREHDYLVRGVGSKIGCAFTSSDGTSTTFRVTVNDLDGNVSWQVD